MVKSLRMKHMPRYKQCTLADQLIRYFTTLHSVLPVN